MTENSSHKKGSGTPWARLAGDWYMDPKYLAAGPDKAAVAGMVFGCVAYSRYQLTDGHIPAAAAYLIGAGMNPAEITRLFDLAVQVGLLAVVEDGWIIPGYTIWQETKDEVAANRAAGAERQRRFRAARAAGNAVSHTVSNGVTNAFVLSTETESETEVEKKNNSAADATEGREDIDLIVEHLSTCLQANGVKKHKPTKAWRNDARLLLDVDGIEVEKVLRAIDWATADEFWKANILSVGSLRKQYDKLRLAAMRGGKPMAPRAEATIVAFDDADMGILAGTGSAA